MTERNELFVPVLIASHPARFSLLSDLHDVAFFTCVYYTHFK